MIKVINKGKKRKLAAEGELTIYNAQTFKADLLKNMNKLDELELDLSKVSEFDTAGFQILALAKKYLQDKNIPMSMVNHSKSVIEVLDLYNMVSYFGDPVVLSEN